MINDTADEYRCVIRRRTEERLIPMNDVLIGLAFVFVIEGLIYAVFPGGAKKMAAQVQNIPEANLRVAGVVALAIGVGGVWLLRG